MDYTIKQVPEDFVVRERFEPELGSGRFACYKLTKRGWTTQSAVSQVSRAFGKRPKFINFAGNKDKQALTEQYISILHGPGKGLELQGGDIRLEYLGRVRKRINLGDSQGNDFEITVRNLPAGSKPKPLEQVPNYFDEQRFGMNLNNHLVGKALIQGRFQEACGLVPETREWLEKSPRDYVGALRSLPRRVLRLYAHAYQSWLWNLTASRYLETLDTEEEGRASRRKVVPHRRIESPIGELVIPTRKVNNIPIPIVGYDTIIPPELEGIIPPLLKKEGLSQEDSRVKQFQEFDLAGDSRELMVTPEGLGIGSLEDDELNPGRKKCLLRFFLQSGSYATMVIKAIFS